MKKAEELLLEIIDLQPVLIGLQNGRYSTGQARQLLRKWILGELDCKHKDYSFNYEFEDLPEITKKQFNMRLYSMGWSHSDFSKFVGVNRTTVSNWKEVPDYAIRLLELIESFGLTKNSKTSLRHESNT